MSRHFCLQRSKPSNGNILVKVTTLNMLVQSSVIVRLGARIEKGVRRVVVVGRQYGLCYGTILVETLQCHTTKRNFVEDY